MRILGVGMALAVVFSWPQTLVIPEFMRQPRLEAEGPEVRVEVRAEPFGLEVEGDARLERLDDFRIRFKSSSGNLSIGLGPDEAVYGLTERIVTDRRRSETFVRAVGGLDRRVVLPRAARIGAWNALHLDSPRSVGRQHVRRVLRDPRLDDIVVSETVAIDLLP